MSGVSVKCKQSANETKRSDETKYTETKLNIPKRNETTESK